MSYITHKFSVALFLLVLTLRNTVSAEIFGKTVGCFSSLPDSFTNQGSNQFQTRQSCSTTCHEKKSKYYALQIKDCWCGDTDPVSAGVSKSDKCNERCLSFSDICGGHDAFTVVKIPESGNLYEQFPDDDENSEKGTSVQSSGDTTTLAGNQDPSASAKSSGAGTASTADPAAHESTGNPGSVSTAEGNMNPSAPTGAVSSTMTAGATTDAPLPGQPPPTPTPNPGGAGPTRNPTAGPSSTTSVQTTIINGSTMVMTKTVEVTASANASANASAQGTQKHSSKSKIIGGVIGGIVGLILIILLVLFIMRWIAERREEERMEKEYQEAIKPVDYEETLYMTSEVSEQQSKYEVKPPKHIVNPFDDARRISNGSLMIDGPGIPKQLTVVNPDQ